MTEKAKQHSLGRKEKVPPRKPHRKHDVLFELSSMSFLGNCLCEKAWHQLLVRESFSNKTLNDMMKARSSTQVFGMGQHSAKLKEPGFYSSAVQRAR